MKINRVRRPVRFYRRPLNTHQKASIEREGERIAEAYETPDEWDDVFAGFDELGRLKPKPVEEKKQ